MKKMFIFFVMLFSIVYCYAENDEDYQFVYGAGYDMPYVNGDFDADNLKTLKPGDERIFMINVTVSPTSSIPIRTALRVTDFNKQIKDETRLGTILNNMKDFVEIKDDSVKLKMGRTILVIFHDGKIIIYYNNGTRMTHATLYKPTEMSAIVHGAIYEGLVDQISKIHWDE